MNLVAEQWAFLQDVAKLIVFAQEKGFKLTGGELWRSAEQQQLYLAAGKSATKNSYHLRRLAIDFNIFLPDGSLLKEAGQAQVLGDFWEGLHNQNRWGGNWTKPVDAPHFERRV